MLAVLNLLFSIHYLQKALGLDPDADNAPAALRAVVECGEKLDQQDLIKKSVRDLWVRYPLSPEAKIFLAVSYTHLTLPTKA